MKYLEKFRWYVENTDWDELLSENNRFLDGFCWGVILMAIIIFSPAVYHILTR